VGLGLSAALLGGVFGSTTQAGVGGVGWGKIVLATMSSGVCIVMGLQLLELIRLPLPSFEFDVPELGTVAAVGGTVGGDGGTGSTGGGSSTAIGNEDGIESGMGSQISFDQDGNLIPGDVLSTTSSTTGPATATSATTTKPQPGSAASLLRTFLLGGSSALIASPCATPVLTSILAFVGSSQNPTLGAALLFVYTLGYSTPLLVVGATGGQALANAQAAAVAEGEGESDDSGSGGGSWVATVGKLVTPVTASVLIWYGTTGFLEATLGDPSLAALAPIMD